jgi:tetratricopeptide (TPR) repeat protein
MNFNNIGEVYEFMGDYNNAKYYYTKSLDINFKIKNLKGISINYNAIGKIEMFEGKPDNAYKLFINALDIDKKLGDKKFLADSYVNLAKASMALKRFAKAKNYLDSTIAIAKQIGSLWHLQSAYEVYSDYYLQKSDYQSALINFKQAALFKDSLLNENNSRHLSTIQQSMKQIKRRKKLNFYFRNSA